VINEPKVIARDRRTAEAYIRSQKCEGWEIVYDRYDDGGFSGGNIERPALKRLMEDIQAGKIDCVVVYKVDRLSRSLLDFARVMETFDKFNVSFVSVTQHFNTTHSMGRLTLNILLSFAQFEREIIGERIRDKLAAQCRRGQWTGGYPVLGYDVDRSERTPKLVINSEEAIQVRRIFSLYLVELCEAKNGRLGNRSRCDTKNRAGDDGERSNLLKPGCWNSCKHNCDGTQCAPIASRVVPQIVASVAKQHVEEQRDDKCRNNGDSKNGC
jgi:DNA invertase Pin-like site-specific DNA recombinase